jgi:hypothetical protein
MNSDINKEISQTTSITKKEKTQDVLNREKTRRVEQGKKTSIKRNKTKNTRT